MNKFSCLEPTAFNEGSPVATHHHETVAEDSHREVGARLQHIGHLKFPLKWCRSIVYGLTWCHTGLVPAGPGVKHSTERSLVVPSNPPRTYTLSSYTMDLHHATCVDGSHHG